MLGEDAESYKRLSRDTESHEEQGQEQRRNASGGSYADVLRLPVAAAPGDDIHPSLSFAIDDTTPGNYGME